MLVSTMKVIILVLSVLKVLKIVSKGQGVLHLVTTFIIDRRSRCKMSTTAALEIAGVGVLGIFRDPKKRKGSYEHKDQLEFYSNLDEGRSNDVGDANSEHFRKRYHFRPKTVEVLALLLGKEIEPVAYTNNAFTSKQKLCIALRFYATGTH